MGKSMSRFDPTREAVLPRTGDGLAAGFGLAVIGAEDSRLSVWAGAGLLLLGAWLVLGAVRAARKARPRPATVAASPGKAEEAPATGVLDRRQIELLRGLPGQQRSSLLEEVTEVFLRDIPERIAGMRLLFEQRQSVELGLHAHRLAGSCANLGAVALRNAALRLELLARQGDWAVTGRALSEIDREWGKVRDALAELSAPP